jgi:hypothetical protein
MCGRISQSETLQYYARHLRPDILEREWMGGDTIPQYNLSLAPRLATRMLNRKLQYDDVTWGLRQRHNHA